MILEVPDLRRVAVAGRAFAPAERGRRALPDGTTEVRDLGRKRAAEKQVARAIDDAHMVAGVDPMEINRRNSLVQKRPERRPKIIGRGPLRRRDR